MNHDELQRILDEREKIGREILSKQGPITLEYARAQFLIIKNKELFEKKFGKAETREATKLMGAKQLKDISIEDYMVIHDEFKKSVQDSGNPI